jgi:hypothetical protein
MAARLPSAVRIGLALILIGGAWFGGWACWVSTRIRVPLYVPISLSQGHIRTPEFTINLKSTYLIEVVVERESDSDGVACLIGIFDCPGNLSVLSISWSLSERGHAVASGNSDLGQAAFGGTRTMGRELGAFQADKGRYVLNLDVLRDGSRLNAGTPHLVVVEAGSAGADADYQRTRAFFVFLLFAPVGLCLILRSAILRRQEAFDAKARACCLTQPGTPAIAGVGHFRGTPAQAAMRAGSGVVGGNRRRNLGPPKRLPFPRTSLFGLVAAIIFILVAISFGVLKTLGRPTYQGLMIRLLQPPAPAQASPRIESLLVRVEFAGPGVRPNLYVNSQLTSWGDLSTVLRKELGRRPPTWPVYFQGDPDMPWEYAMEAIDVIRGFQAEVVLLTARTTPRLVRWPSYAPP